MKNTGSFVCSLIGAIFGLIGGILWTACADAVNTIAGNSTLYLILFIVLGIGGAVLALVGGIQALHFKKGGLALTLFGLLFQIGLVIAACVYVGGFSFLLTLPTLVAVILLLVGTILAAKKPPVQE